MNHDLLLRHCVEVLDTYDRYMESVEEHVNDYVKWRKVTEDVDRDFIVEVFSGCVRYSNIINVILDGFYSKDGKNTLRSEQHFYGVLSYLALFRLDELGMTHFRQFVSSQDTNRMYRFFSFFLDETNLLTWIKCQWEKLYEQSFVEDNLIGPIMRWMPELQEMTQQMKTKIENKLKPKLKTQSATRPKPFNLTQPRARSVPIPEPIPKLQKHKPPPKTLYHQPPEFELIDQIRQANRRKAEECLMEASRQQFACANPEKSQKTKEIMNKIITEGQAQLDFNRQKANTAPSFLLSPRSTRAGSSKRRRHRGQEVPIKMTTAAILREGALYQKKEEKELQRLESLEAGAKDASEFLKWQTGMRQQDLEAEFAEVERRRLAGKISHEEAILAHQNLMKENRRKVQEVREETKKMMHEYLEKKFKEEQEMKRLVEDTMQGHRNAKEAQKKLQEYKQKLVQEVTEESRELMRMAIEEAEAEMRKKMDLIHQIRAMQAAPVIRQKFIDFTETSGAGLLSEMSIAELRERLSLMKTAEKEEEENKRDEILASKEAKDQYLLETLERISKHRLEKTKTAALRLEARKKGEPKKMEIQNEKLTELQKMYEEKKKQRLKEQEVKIVVDPKSVKKTQSLINQKKQLEENRWRELEATRERSAKIATQDFVTNTSNRLTMAT
ncbi:hypothetical protein CHS0354_041220 [Potamilus streckersoni]|uniref:Cilia- and flagella-associated protein 99 n=1 Tax=Potamilus streckersoni TaxID=2493646 RepID=A0AAE0SDY2_9BIVA|nr:hypothetical protein CHS0354_041220 [Potamilus streckersoni]